jgi:hypothetical protein
MQPIRLSVSCDEMEDTTPEFVTQILIAWPELADYGEGLGDALVQPGTAALAATELWLLRDTWLERDADWVEDLPRIAHRHLADQSFLARMRSSAEYFALEIESGRAHEHTARCSADEVNLHLALRSLDMMSTEDLLEVPDALALGVPDLADGWQGHVSMGYDYLLRDVDIEMLWNPSLDGIENDEAFLKQYGVAPMHPEQWFNFFNDVDVESLPEAFRSA